MKKLLFLLFSFVSVFLSSISWSLSFLHPAFNRLDIAELNKLRKTELNDQELITYFEAEALNLRGKTHASQDLLEALKSKCEEPTSKANPPKRAVVCLLAELGFSTDLSALTLHFKRDKIQEGLKAIQSGEFSFEEKAYLEGRILWKIPDELGGNSGKSLLGWESLKRIRPNLSCSDFFMSQIYQNQGDKGLAEEALERALSHTPPDPRALLSKKQETMPSQSRFYFGIVGNPAGGAGILIGKRDDQLGDTPRKIDVSISAQSRGVFLGRMTYEDKESLRPYILTGRVLAASEIDQYFGLGSQSSLTHLTEISQSRSQGSLGIRHCFSNLYAELDAGWFLREPTSVVGFESSDGALRERQASLLASLELGWAEKNSFQAFLRITAAQKQIASTHSFEVYQIGLIKNFSLGKFGELHFITGARTLTGQKPLGMLSQLSGNVEIPGVRLGRFRDVSAWVMTAEWQKHLAREFDFVLFGNLASLRGPMLRGGGAALIIGSGNFRSRVEVGHFAGETVIQTGVQIFSE